MVAEFQKLDHETLVQRTDTLLYDILRNIENGKIDTDILCELIEDFAGREYVIVMKLKNDIELLDEDKDFIAKYIEKKHEQSISVQGE